MQRLPWIIWVGPNRNHKCPYKKERGRFDFRREEGNMMAETEIRLMYFKEGGRGHNRRIQVSIRSQKKNRQGNGFSPQSLQKDPTHPVNTLVLSLRFTRDF